MSKHLPDTYYRDPAGGAAINQNSRGGQGCCWSPRKMAWSPAVLSLLLQIKTQGNRGGEKLHLVPARLPEAGAVATCPGGRSCGRDIIAAWVLKSQVEKRERSPGWRADQAHVIGPGPFQGHTDVQEGVGGGAPQGRPPAEAQKTERRQQRRDCDLVGEAPQCWWLLLHLLPPWATETQDESRGSRPRWWVHRPGSGSGSGSEGTDLTQCPSFPHLVNGFNNTNN